MSLIRGHYVSGSMMRCRNPGLVAASAAVVLFFSSSQDAAAFSCEMSGWAMDVGQIDPTSTVPLDNSGRIQIRCRDGNPGDTVLLCPAIGALHSTHDKSARKMIPLSGAGSEERFVAYNLFTDAARTRVWTHPAWGAPGDVPSVRAHIREDGTAEAEFGIHSRVWPNTHSGHSGMYRGSTVPGSGDQQLFFDINSSSDQCSYTSSSTGGGEIEVLGTVIDSCTITGSDAVDFGRRGVGSGIVEAQGNISVRCTEATDFSVSLGGGAQNNILDRRMSKGSDMISYQLYTDPGRSSIFGDGVRGSQRAGTGMNAADVNVPVYGLADLSKNPPAGEYSDRVIITVTY
ncbi:hypothetical protein GA830_00820 [Mesorhizobium sp. NBSH29]|uniref:Csu type fimbrial protein n=1 Tax=Mesorhizobium sp. NBSH29 TaxID=2654249 RepID=UPI0018C02749|nr:spore coat U domain-containing protein [Mesorhizobium sp. NBSH29]QPC85448.1 hypothetical protein GA830_00820 [Mesorhizobium sp. NBSH29]